MEECMADKSRILIIEDETDFARALELLLSAKGYDVDSANDGLTGLEKARQGNPNNPDLIILDVMLPKINGYKIARLLKFDDKFRHIPIIMLTARAEEKDEQIGMETGADMYMTKPLDNKELLKNIAKLIK